MYCNYLDKYFLFASQITRALSPGTWKKTKKTRSRRGPSCCTKDWTICSRNRSIEVGFYTRTLLNFATDFFHLPDLKEKTDDKGLEKFLFDGDTDLVRADPGAVDDDDDYFEVPGETYEEIKADLNDTGIVFFEGDSFDDILRHPSEDCLDSDVSCSNGEGCYSPEEKCDRYVQCNDNSDEAGCTCSDYIRNVANEKVCDGYNDCPDGSDEKGKSILQKFELTV